MMPKRWLSLCEWRGRFVAALAAITAMLFMTGTTVANATPLPDPALHTYYLYVFSNPVAGKEAEYNTWYNEVHAPDVVSIPGFVWAQRYTWSDIQLTVPGQPPFPKKSDYLIVFKIETSDLNSVFTEVRRRLKSGETHASPALDLKTISSYTARAASDVKSGNRSAPPGSDPTVKPSAYDDYIHIVFADPPAGREQEYGDWYDAHHLPDCLTIPGYIFGQRFVLAETQLAPTEGPKNLAMFTLRTPDIGATLGTFAKVGPTAYIAPVFKVAGTKGYVYKAIGPKLYGDAERLKRSAAPTPAR